MWWIFWAASETGGVAGVGNLEAKKASSDDTSNRLLDGTGGNVL